MPIYLSINAIHHKIMPLKLHTNHIIFLGFSLILVIMTVLTMIWLTHISSSNVHINDIVKSQNKAEHVFAMRDAANQRALSLYRMSVLTDPFEQDDEYLKFRKQAEKFIKARQALIDIGETEMEKDAWHTAQPLIQKGTRSQTLVADIISDDDIDAANKLMIDDVIPIQNEVSFHLTKMLDLQKAHVSIELAEATQQNNRVYFQISILGSAALIIGIIITFFVLRTSTKNQQKLILAQQDAQDANQHKSLFLANMSHELRTPLNAIIGYSEILQEEVTTLENTDLTSDLNKIHDSGQHLLSLINDILDVSKIEAGKMEFYPEDFNLAMLIEDICSTVQPLLGKNNNSLQVTFSDFDEDMYTDLTKLRQCLLNLLSNAIKFTLDGEVCLTLSRFSVKKETWITLSVKDSGIGMEKNQMTHLFSPFTQADTSTTRNFGGTGLGLNISKQFCKMMGGTISAVSEPSIGSTFSISIPTKTASPSKEKH